jgi:hypothetical protein
MVSTKRMAKVSNLTQSPRLPTFLPVHTTVPLVSNKETPYLISNKVKPQLLVMDTMSLISNTATPLDSIKKAFPVRALVTTLQLLQRVSGLLMVFRINRSSMRWLGTPPKLLISSTLIHEPAWRCSWIVGVAEF